MPNLKGKRVLITGGSSRVGRNIILSLENKGVLVVPHYNKTSISGGIKGAIENVKDIQNVVQKTVKKLGGLDILINNAAVFYKTPLNKVTVKEWDDLININLRAAFFFSKFAAPFLKKSAAGQIISIADTYGVSPAVGYVPYGISKAGIIAMTIGLAKELAPDVLVNCVCPGVINIDVRSKKQKARSKKALKATLLKRLVEIEDVVNTVLFLATNNSITGQAIFVDSGKHV